MGTRHYPLSTRAIAIGVVLDGNPLEHTEKRFGLGNALLSAWCREAGVMVKRGAPGGALRPARLDPIGAISGHGRRLGFEDRVTIQIGLNRGLSLRKIAAMTRVSAATISREVSKRALEKRGEKLYDARVAHQAASDARSRARASKIETNTVLRAEVVARLERKFSPEQVAADLVKSFPDDEGMRVSHETIYQALYVQGRGALRHELTVEKALRSDRVTRKPRSKLPARSNRPWLDGARLVDRPPEAADRAVSGNWEGDLVVGPDNSGIVTLVERSSRFALIGRLPGRRDSETVTDRLQGMIRTLPEALFTTLTWDQGSEMAEHARFTIATGCEVFFCDPHSPWQRGSNENLNGLIRDFYPKGTNFNDVTDAEIAKMQDLLNERPRKTLGWLTPGEKLDQQLRGVALTS